MNKTVGHVLLIIPHQLMSKTLSKSWHSCFEMTSMIGLRSWQPLSITFEIEECSMILLVLAFFLVMHNGYPYRIVRRIYTRNVRKIFELHSIRTCLKYFYLSTSFICAGAACGDFLQHSYCYALLLGGDASHYTKGMLCLRG